MIIRWMKGGELCPVLNIPRLLLIDSFGSLDYRQLVRRDLRTSDIHYFLPQSCCLQVNNPFLLWHLCVLELETFGSLSLVAPENLKP